MSGRRRNAWVSALYLAGLFVGVPLASFDEQLDALADAQALQVTSPDAEAALADLLLKAPSHGPVALPVLASARSVAVVPEPAPSFAPRTCAPTEVPLRI